MEWQLHHRFPHDVVEAGLTLILIDKEPLFYSDIICQSDRLTVTRIRHGLVGAPPHGLTFRLQLPEMVSLSIPEYLSPNPPLRHFRLSFCVPNRNTVEKIWRAAPHASTRQNVSRRRSMDSTLEPVNGAKIPISKSRKILQLHSN